MAAALTWVRAAPERASANGPTCDWSGTVVATSAARFDRSSGPLAGGEALAGGPPVVVAPPQAAATRTAAQRTVTSRADRRSLDSTAEFSGTPEGGVNDRERPAPHLRTVPSDRSRGLLAPPLPAGERRRGDPAALKRGRPLVGQRMADRHDADGHEVGRDAQLVLERLDVRRQSGCRQSPTPARHRPPRA